VGYRVFSLKAALAQLSSSAQPNLKQAGAVLRQQAEVALTGAAVPGSRTEMLAAACRWDIYFDNSTVPKHGCGIVTCVLQEVVTDVVACYVLTYTSRDCTLHCSLPAAAGCSSTSSIDNLHLISRI
jgi:hypothetical protein